MELNRLLRRKKGEGNMKKFFGVIGIIVALGIAGILIYASTLPNTTKIERSVLVKAPAESIYPLIADFHNWTAWSPFEKMDPSMLKTYTGAEKGKGSIVTWTGKGMDGEGRMEITDATEPSMAKVELDYIKPMQMVNTFDFTLAPEGDSTKVTWAMSGPNPFMAKVFSVFMNRDKIMGGVFDDGLSQIKAKAEAMPPPAKAAMKKSVKKK
jgi:hypothetical protein